MTYILTDAEQTVVTLHPEKDGTPIAVTGVRFESSDVQVATVIQDVNNPLHAAVTEVGPGTCRITARADGITPEVLNVEVLADGRGIKLNLRVGVAEPVTPIDPPPASGASMSGLRNPWAPSITDANGDVWSQSNPTGGEGGGASLLMKNGEILRTYNGSPAPGGIEVFNWLVYGGSYGVQFWASNFHAYGITQVDGVDMYIDQGASSGDDHTSAFAFPFYFDALSPVDVAVPNGSLTIFTNQIVTSVPGANYHTSGDISLELGTLFNVTAPIQITHIRFYRPSVVYPSPFDGIPTNPYNIGRIWDAHGSLLVEKLCPVQSAEGWQQMALDSPLRLPTANGYVVTVSSWVLEAYTHTDGVFVTPLVRGPVTAMSGVYGPVNTFPNNTSWAPNFVHGGHPFNQSSFFRDVVFVPDAPPEPP